MTAKQWFSWHSLSGVWFGLLLFVICWTGAFATISYELDWLFDDTVRAAESSPQVSLASAYEKVQEAYPDARIGIAFAGLESHFAHDFVVRLPDNPWQHIYVDPYTGNIQGKTSFLNIQRFFRDFHMHFFGVFDSIVSYYLVLLFAIPLCVSTISALYLYRGWWKKFFTLKLSGDTRAKVASSHKLAGVWSLWLAVVIAITSMWYLFEFVRMDLADGKTAFTDVGDFAVNPLPALQPQDKPQLSVVALAAKVREARPDLEIRAIRYSGGYFYVEGQSSDLLVRDRANKVYVNPYTGEVVYSQTASSQGIYWRLSDTADPLHFGNFAGIWVKILWCIFGVVLSFLVLSGTYMYVKRQLKLRRKEDLRGVKASLVFSLSLLVCVAYYAYQTLMNYGVAGQFPVLPTGSVLFLSIWTLVTCFIIVVWGGALLNLCREATLISKPKVSHHHL
ncbi:peptidase [Pseudoalteromonas sp. GCY]|uniref:PepSY-associated TM helix domain-containing protein n=1 Tax=Pseudoalteromonas sp. GCY TaxID=2003316 RepID=UPI000BFEBB8E|nr:PepSY-associated TM helix domain-containing protein [Pseudoalteromonas sp. GCY]PHI35570.1 peptidase [Pseudoalteromonas sp. GCY]QQQ67383.1 PepSY domain-containing protein [Pseudoalteromonas sp. GCY]